MARSWPDEPAKSVLPHFEAGGLPKTAKVASIGAQQSYGFARCGCIPFANGRFLDYDLCVAWPDVSVPVGNQQGEDNVGYQNHPRGRRRPAETGVNATSERASELRETALAPPRYDLNQNLRHIPPRIRRNPGVAPRSPATGAAPDARTNAHHTARRAPRKSSHGRKLFPVGGAPVDTLLPPGSSTRSALCTTSPEEGIPCFRESMQSMNVEALLHAQ
jgi:hypothetical protein